MMVVVVVIAFREKMALDFARIENFLADNALDFTSGRR